MQKSRSIISFLIFCLIFSQASPVYSYYLASEMLYESGLKYYNAGQYDLALQEFKKALIANPDYKSAQDYIALITQQPVTEIKPSATQPQTQVIQPPQIPEGISQIPSREQTISNALTQIEHPANGPEAARATKTILSGPVPLAGPLRVIPVETVKNSSALIEVEKEKSIVMRGNHINRFLETQPGIVAITKPSASELMIEGKNYGYTYVHIWDENGRTTVQFLVIPKKNPGPTYDELMRQEEESARNFKLRYSIDWSSFQEGGGFDKLHRDYYEYTHNLSLTGDTPYGLLDASIILQQHNGEYFPASYTIGLTDGVWSQFKGFSIRAFDFIPSITNQSFSGADVHGVQFSSPVAHQKIDYTVFWGQERSQGVFGPFLSPDYSRNRDSYLSGLNIDVNPTQRQLYRFSVFEGYGRDRDPDLNRNGYNAQAHYGLGAWGLNFETANDSQNFAHQASATMVGSQMQLTEEVRDIDKDFHSMTGLGYRAGEIGSLTSIMIRPSPKLDITSSLDVFRDRLFPNPEETNRWNEDLYIDSTVYFDNFTRARLDYMLQNNIGRLAPLRSHNAGIGLYRTFDWLNNMSTFVTYRFQDNTYFVSPETDYTNDKVMLGMRMRLIGQLYYFLSQEYNWTQLKVSGERAEPRALETGVDWNNQIGRSPFFGSTRLLYRNEENTSSPISFFAGEDYIEWYAELAYRPNPGVEAFFSGRVRRIWPDNHSISKSAEVALNAGMRYLWDTGVRWEPIGMIEGYVFKDYNYDGLKTNDEPTIPGVKIWLGKNKSRITNEHGYFLFPKVKARKATIYIDVSSLPANYVLTSPASCTISISQGSITSVNFGIASRTEITGIIFEDRNGDGVFDPGDRPMKGISVLLEDGTKATTDGFGKYVVNKVNPGVHRLNLDLRNLPPEYIPTVSIFKDINLLEGASFVYNFPLKKVTK